MRGWIFLGAIACAGPPEPEVQVDVRLFGHLPGAIAGWQALRRPEALGITRSVEGGLPTAERRVPLEVAAFTAIDPNGVERSVTARYWPGTEVEEGLALPDEAWWAPGAWTLRMTHEDVTAEVEFQVYSHGQRGTLDPSTPALFARNLDAEVVAGLPTWGLLDAFFVFRIVDLAGPDPRLLVYSAQDVPSRPDHCRAATLPLALTPAGYATTEVGELVVRDRWPLRVDGGAMRFGVGVDAEWGGPTLEGLEVDVWLDAVDLAPLVAAPLADVTGDEACAAIAEHRPCEPCPNRPERLCVPLAFRNGTAPLYDDEPEWAAARDTPCLPPRAGQYEKLATGLACATIGPAGMGAGLTLLALAAARRRRSAASQPSS